MLMIQIHSFPVIHGKSQLNEPEFRSIIIKDPKESSFPIGSKQFINWKSSLPPSSKYYYLCSFIK